MNPLIRKGGSQHRMSQFSRPQPRSNPGCYLGGASTHHQVPRLHLSTPTTQAPRGIFLLAFKSLYFISKGRNGPVPPTRCGRRRPRPRATRSACGHAQRSPLPRRGRKPKQAARGKRGADRRRRRTTGGPDIRLLRRPTPQPRELRSALPASPLPEAREPAALPPPAARAAAPPPRRAGGSWLPRRPSEALLHGELRAAPHPGTGRRTPGIRAYFGRRMRSKPAELEEVPGRPRRAPPSHFTGARSRAPSPQSLWSALRDAETAGLGEKTAWCLLSRRKPSCLTSIVLGRFLKDTGFGSWG